MTNPDKSSLADGERDAELRQRETSPEPALQLQGQHQTSDADWTPRSARIAVVVAGTSLLPFVWLATVAVNLGDPEWWSPVPLLFLLPAWMSPSFGFIVNEMVVIGSFMLFSWPLMDGRPRLLWWSASAILLLQVLHWMYLASVRGEGMRLDASHTQSVCMINVVLTCVLIGLALVCWKRPNFLLALGFQWLAWFWLAMYSFPLLFDLVGGV